MKMPEYFLLSRPATTAIADCPPADVPAFPGAPHSISRRYRRRPWLTALALLFLMVVGAMSAGGVHGAPPRVYLIPVRGDVEPAMAAFLERAVRQSADDPEAVLVFELDTFGGRVDAALDIVDTLLQAAPRRTIAFVATKAISAGALIALACNDLVMRPSTTIGDCAPITYSQEGPQMMGEKFQSPLRAKFRTLARRNNYPAVLAEAMVSADMEVHAVTIRGETRYLDGGELADLTEAEKKEITARRTVVAKGELLTMDDAEARELGFSRLTAGSVAEMLPALGITDYQLLRIEETWSESFARLIARFSPLLLMIGLGALYVELKAPGFGLPGIVGILCLGLVFLNQYLVGLASYTDLLFLLLGLVLLAMEVFVLPGFGLAGIAGFFCIGIGMILSFQDFVVPDPSLPWQQEILTANVVQVLGAFLAAFLFGLIFLRFLLPRLGQVVEGPYLRETLAGAHADSVEGRRVTPGLEGILLTDLRPAGKMAVGDDSFDVSSEGEFLEKGTPVVVSEIRGNRIVVRRSGAEKP